MSDEEMPKLEMFVCHRLFPLCFAWPIGLGLDFAGFHRRKGFPGEAKNSRKFMLLLPTV
jgi:hypothetical protein